MPVSCLLQLPAKWTTLQVVGSRARGVNSFYPAAVRVKNDTTKPHEIPSKKFYYFNWDDGFINQNVSGKLEKHVYDYIVTREIRKCFEECLVKTFDYFVWKRVPLARGRETFIPTCNMPAEFLVEEVIKDVEKVFKGRAKILRSTRGRPDEAKRLETLVKTISSGHIADLCVQMTQSYRVNKNWNSHGAKVGAAICEAAGLFAMLENHEKGGVFDENFRQKIPRGRVLTGQMHGSEDNVYMEYMVAPYQRGSPATMTYSHFFDPVTDCSTNVELPPAAERIVDFVDSYNNKELGIPKARPTRAHTFDFMCTYRGVHLLDGECKDSSTTEDVQLLLATAMSQFVYRDSALAMLTTSTTIEFYKMLKNGNADRPLVYKRTLPAYKMGRVRRDNYFPNEGDLDDPPGCEHSERTKDTNLDPAFWNKTPLEARSIITMLLHAVDVLVDEILAIDLHAAVLRKKIAYDNNFEEPAYLDTHDDEARARRTIANDKAFILGPEFFGLEKQDIEREQVPQPVDRELVESICNLIQTRVSHQSTSHSDREMRGSGDQ